MAAPSNPTGQPKYASGNSSDGLRNALLAPHATSGHQVFPRRRASDGSRNVPPAPAPAATRRAFDGLVNAPPAPANTCAESSSQMKHLPYDVFINHYGKDAKHGIASNIYNKLGATGLRVFLDKDELNSGDLIPETLEAAMRSSSVHIAIFSENYAESPWCLDELEFIQGLPGIKFIPIFYHVDHSTLRWAIKGKGIYGEAFSKDKMKKRYNSKQLEKWKSALHKASLHTGEIISNQGEEEKAVTKVVNLVLKELKKVRIDVAKYPVGLDEAEQDFNNTLLNSAHAREVRVVGIWGMGGAGKTTLAKHLFNKKSSIFNGRSCFVSDVREAARKELLCEKQKELLKGLVDLKNADFNNVDEGKEILRSRLKSAPVLIVLDDVDHIDQLDALLPGRDSIGHGNLIIVTTRELKVLKAWGISAIYKIRALNDARAEELFCWHAFGQPSPLLGFEDLAKEFIKACYGLPLSLKVFGGLLRGEVDKKYWQSQLEKVCRIVPDDIKSKLRISYDALDKEEKEMFLDVACFFIGERSSRAIAVWDGSQWSGLHGWQMLFNKCLVELDEYNLIRMHDHLRDLGREIANQRSPYRLWSKKQIIEIQPQQEAVRVRGMADAFGENCCPRHGHIILNTNEGERTLHPGSLGLKIFIGGGDFIDEQYSELSKDLVYLQWSGFQHKNIPSWLPLKKLRILQLSHPARLQGLWERDADAPSALKELFIRVAYELEKIESLKSLTSLEVLRIYKCPELDGLPGLGESISLKEIELTGCHKLQNIEALESLTSLETLKIFDCRQLNALPSLAQLTSLKEIQLIRCKQLEKIESLKSLTSLEVLKIYGCLQLDGLPGLGELTSLKKIALTECHKLQNIEGLESLTSLETLKITECRQLNALPSLAQLTSLKKIELSECNQLEKIESLKSLTSLKVLRINDCPELDGLPGLGESISLKEIALTGCHKLQNIEGLESLTSLETLVITECRQLNALPSLAGSTSLKKIELSGWKQLEKIESLKSLTSLEVLRINECPELDGLPRLGESISLKEIALTGCHKLQNIEGLESLTSLETLEITECRQLNALPSLAQSTSLKEIDLYECNQLEKIESLKSLASLEVLRIYECPELDGLPGLGESISLKEIALTGCHKLQNIEGLESLTSLETLKIIDCRQLNAPPSFAELTSLKEIELRECHNWKKIEGIETLRLLEKLIIDDCREFNTLSNLAELTSLVKLKLIKCYKLEKIGGLDSLRSLEMLRIEDCPESDTVPSLVKLTLSEEFKLDKFEVHACLKTPYRVLLEKRKLIVAVNDVSVVEPFISEIQALQREVIIWRRTEIDVGSLKTFLTSFPLKSVVEFTSFGGLKLRRPENSGDANAILICFIVDSLYPKLHFHLYTDTGNCFNTELANGIWLLMGVFPEAANRYEIWASSEDKDVKVKEAWVVMGEEGSMLQAFHHLSQS